MPNVAGQLRKRLLLADNHELILLGIASLLAPDYDIVGHAADGRQLIEQAERLVPDVIVLDISMPVMNGMEAMRRLRVMLPKTRLIVLTQYLDSHYVYAAFLTGATAYVSKQSAATELTAAIQMSLADGYYVSSLVAPRDLSKFALRNTKANPAHMFGGRLTGRQREVLQLLAEGKTGKEIGTILDVSTKTVEFHKSGIMDELGLRTTAELTRYALANGIIAE